MVRNTMKQVETARNNINMRYDIFSSNIIDIKETSNTVFDMIVNGFLFGYMQGMKAAKAEFKKGGAC